ncbi:DNA-binding protein [Micromonospora sp. WMMA1998]|uniref:DNA-binding protein n=1 Tax=Micromonospora TaxID=1873 RepID=UPI0020A31703|nr:MULTISPECIES: DNA-binding protein [unclassified Micromonospora]WBC15374.1 DNA-binding protein [Micromonospora sp. WMMA1998]
MDDMVTVDNDPFTAPDAAQARAHRNYAALLRIAERHAGTNSRRRRYAHPDVPDAYEAATLVMALAGGAELEEGEEPVDQADLMAALTLIPHVRAEVDVLEAGLLQVARGRGMTWQAIAFGLGLGSAQAARQRYERLTVRTGTGD